MISRHKRRFDFGDCDSIQIDARAAETFLSGILKNRAKFHIVDFLRDLSTVMSQSNVEQIAHNVKGGRYTEAEAESSCNENSYEIHKSTSKKCRIK